MQPTKDLDKEEVRVNFAQDISALDDIINNIDTVNNLPPRAKTAFKRLAHNQKRMLRLIKRALT